MVRLFRVQQRVMSGEQSTRTRLLVSTRLTIGLASTTDTQYISNRLQLLSDPADPMFENPTNSACWNFQYKAFIKLCAKTQFIKSLRGDNLVMVTPIYKKLGIIGLLIT